MKKTIPLDSRKAGALVLVLTLGLAAEVANADFTFGDVESLPELINTPGISPGDFTMTADGLEAYFVYISRPGGYGGEDIYVSSREMKGDPWGEPVNLGPPVNTSACDGTPSISADELELYFADVGPSGSPYRPGGHGGGDIWVAKRRSKDENWGNPVNLGPTINSSSMETYPSISTDGLSLYFSSSGDIFVTTRARKDDDWGTPVNVGVPPNTSSWEGFPNISADGRVLFFYSDRPGGYGGMDIYMAMRPTVSNAWGPAVNLGPMINTPYYDISPSLSVDGCTLHFAHNDTTGWGGTFKIYRMTISPVVDFNGDGIVDSTDMCIIVDHWGEDYSSCDIGPTPFGDGIVDVQDLIVLSEHLFENVDDPTLVAHWALDETEGNTAQDSANANDGFVHGEPTWHADGGQVAGALELDGIDDYISSNSILNPADGAFSVFAWIRGGAPGQVILSQESGTNWLMADLLDGTLRTDLKNPATTGRGTTPPGPPLISPTVITNGNWHRVGFTWDGANKILYVDDVEVAHDTQTGLKGWDGGLYIGAGKNLEPDTFWFGMIDDIRIYSRAVSPYQIAVLTQ
ncbi:MAG: PD40 domain-containing protein [Phycisphaerae bacterium]|nr:PD40 domain-containing protein [Phycisphaerae bacterium]